MAYIGVRPAGISSASQVETDQLTVDNVKIDGNTISSTDTNGDITLDPDGTGDTIVASGNVGIGTSSADTKIHIAGNSTTRNSIVNCLTIDGGTSVANPYSGFGTGITIQGYDYGDAVRDYAYIQSVMTSSSSSAGGGDAGFSSALTFSTTSSGSGSNIPQERLRIDSSGNVGIGVSPSNALDVQTSAGKFSVIASGSESVAITSSGASQYRASQHEFKNGDASSEFMRLTSAGDVGIGRSDPQNIVGSHGGGLVVKSASGRAATTTAVAFQDSSGNNQFQQLHNGQTTFSTGSTERLRINSSGNVGINTTSPNTSYKTTIQADSTTGALSIDGPATNGYWAAEWDMPSGSTYGILFKNNGSNVGNIRINASSTSYNTSSDHRLKEAVVDMTGAITRVKSLQPKRFNFIADDSVTVDGFMAHEAQTVVPEAVTGTHNEVDADGNPVYQGIDQSKLVPLLTGALQEAITKIETLETQRADLEARLTALENA